MLALAIDKSNTIYESAEDQVLYASQDDGKTWDQCISSSVEQILLDGNSKMLIVRDASLQFSKDSRKSWEAQTGLGADSDISCLVAPLGLSPESPLWVGLSNGKVMKVKKR